jgi:hypothetical protein
LVENPTFDSQTKETLTLKSSAFGSKCELSDEFIKKGVFVLFLHFEVLTRDSYKVRDRGECLDLGQI